MAPNLSIEDQVAQLVQLLKVLAVTQLNQKGLEEYLLMCSKIPPNFFPLDFGEVVAKRFNADPEVLRKVFTHVSAPATPIALDVEFDVLVPRNGWLYDYIQYTRNTEPPTVFHFFAAVVVIGAVLERRIYIRRGNNDLFPNVNVVLVAPAGRCKKTTACEKAVNLFRRIGGNVLADKITPEAIIESFKSSQSATGLLYAPEWAVFLGKQQYMEGLVPMLTALFDCPEIWSSGTLARSTTALKNVAISHLAATTIDWMQSSISKDAFSGGFMSRLLFVVQHDTSRSFPFAPPLDDVLANKLITGLLNMQKVSGEVKITPAGRAWYERWYHDRKTNAVEKQLAGYFERKPDRLLQLAMVLNAAQDVTRLELDEKVLVQAEQMLTWIEKFLPGAFAELSSNTIGDDQHRLLKQIRKHKGEIAHTDWLRLNTNRMNADSFRKSVETLKQAGMLVFDSTKSKYFLLPAGWREE